MYQVDVGEGTEFDCAPEREGELAQSIGQGVFQAAFDAPKATFCR